MARRPSTNSDSSSEPTNTDDISEPTNTDDSSEPEHLCPYLEESPVHNRIEHSAGKNREPVVMCKTYESLSSQLKMNQSRLVTIESACVAFLACQCESATHRSVKSPVAIPEDGILC